MKTMLSRFGFAVALLLVVGCAPSKKYYYIGESDVPPAAKLNFPLTELVERLTQAPSGYSEFPFRPSHIPKPDGEKYLQYFYNIPELGELVGVGFSPKKSSDSFQQWAFTIQFPRIKPEQLFKPEDIRKVKTRYEWKVFEVIQGPLQGACVSDHSLHEQKQGFFNPNDRTISVFSKEMNPDGTITMGCE